MEAQNDIYGVKSPGGFVFGVQGWNWGDPKPTSITFFLDGTARVSDQHGRPIKGAVIDDGTTMRKEVLFAQSGPNDNDDPAVRAKLGNHQDVVRALTNERLVWYTIPFAGWPQLPYAILKEIATRLPLTPVEELRKIKNKAMRADALRMRREMEEASVREAPDDDE